jgi:hypothetical protein
LNPYYYYYYPKCSGDGGGETHDLKRKQGSKDHQEKKNMKQVP